jgi:hypothetical protein
VGRAWIGALYYATGIPFMLKAAPPFAEFLQARYQGIEAPPVIPLLTNPITVLLAGVGLYRLWCRPSPARPLPGDAAFRVGRPCFCCSPDTRGNVSRSASFRTFAHAAFEP